MKLQSFFTKSSSNGLFKSLAFIFGSAIFLGVSAFSIHQYETINHQGKTIQHQHDKITELRSSYLDHNYLNEELADENKILQRTIGDLTDSIASLHIQIFHLQKVVNSQASTIQKLKGQINNLQTQYASLKSEITTLSKAETIDKPKIKQLEQQKTEIREEIKELEVAKEQTVAIHDNVTEELMARQVREARYLRLSSIISNTQIKFKNITLLEQKNGKPLQRLSKNDNKWRYTMLEFFLEHEHLKTLIDERFIVKIIDADNHKVLSYIEQNPSFPESSLDTKGAAFQFDGNMIELAFYNNTLKKGKNYDLEIFYIADDGKEYLLSNGSRSLIMNRRMLNLK